MSYSTSSSYETAGYSAGWSQDTQQPLASNWWEDICPCEDLTPHTSADCKNSPRQLSTKHHSAKSHKSSESSKPSRSAASSAVKSSSSPRRSQPEPVFTFPSPISSDSTPYSLPASSPAMSSRSGRSSGSHSSRESKKGRSTQSIQQLIDSLETHRVNTLTELCRIERVAVSYDQDDINTFRGPMTSAWQYYINSKQFLTELRGLTRNYPISGEVVDEAHLRVMNDAESDRSWNVAWLCLVKMRDDGLLSDYAQKESWRPEMWGGRDPTQEEADQLAQCFEYEWSKAVDKMLRHWSVAPVWR